MKELLMSDAKDVNEDISGYVLVTIKKCHGVFVSASGISTLLLGALEIAKAEILLEGIVEKKK